MSYCFDGAELRRRRQASGIRIERLAVALDRCASTILLYEAGRISRPSLSWPCYAKSWAARLLT